jgi:hypothetical protein
MYAHVLQMFFICSSNVLQIFNICGVPLRHTRTYAPAPLPYTALVQTHGNGNQDKADPVEGGKALTVMGQ